MVDSFGDDWFGKIGICVLVGSIGIGEVVGAFRGERAHPHGHVDPTDPLSEHLAVEASYVTTANVTAQIVMVPPSSFR